MNRERIEAWIAQTKTPHSRPPPFVPGIKPDTMENILNPSSPPHSDVYLVDDLDRTPRNDHSPKRRKFQAIESLSHRQRPITEGTPSLHDTSSVTRSTRSTRTGTTGARKSKGSRSPVKSVSDLRLSEKPVESLELDSFDQLPSDVAALFAQVKRVCCGDGIVPQLIKEDFLSSLTPRDMGYSDASFYDAEQWATSVGLRPWRADRELEVLSKVVTNTKECKRENFSEAAWNSRVHEPLLDFVLDCFAGQVRHYDVTRAAIDKAYIPSLEVGVDMQAKMVDYCLTLAGDDIMSSAKQRNKANRSVSINHTSYEPMRDRPIAVNIETKAPGSSNSEAEAQLSVWTLAHLKRLRSLACTSNSTLTIDVTIPVIYVCGGEWHLYFVRDRADKMEMIEACPIGDTRTLVGCYKVATFLRHLGIWIRLVYRDWALRNVLTVGSASTVQNPLAADGAVFDT
ncbi:hypothetical protein FALCPG4_015930 [Fusarium falciforme]